MPLISADQTFALSAAILVMVAFGFWAEAKSWGQKLGGPLILLAVAMAASNLGVIPHSAPVYDTVGGVLVPLAIPLLLLRADFRTIFKESGSMLGAFMVAAGATFVGALVGALVVNMGPQEAQIAGTVAASYIGGSLNFVATAEAVGIKDSSIYVAGLSADAAGAVVFLILLMLLPAFAFVRRAMPSEFFRENRQARDSQREIEEPEPGPEFKLLHIANGLAISFLVCALSLWLASLFNLGSLFILIVTAITLLIANFAKPLLKHVSAEFEVGTLFMYIFFVVIGAGADLGQVVGAAFPILMFILVMVVVHLVLLVALGRLFRLDLAEVMIASNACILGPAPAAALAASKGWKPLIAPGILVGLFGYAIATFVGVGLAALLG